MDPVNMQVEVMKGVCKLSSHWAERRHGWPSVGTQVKDCKEILYVYLPFIFSQCLKKGWSQWKKSTEGLWLWLRWDKQRLWAENLQSNFWVETCGPESTWMEHRGFQRLVGPQWEHRKWQWLFSWTGCSGDSSALAMAMLEVLMKVVSGNREPMGKVTEVAVQEEKQR